MATTCGVGVNSHAITSSNLVVPTSDKAGYNMSPMFHFYTCGEVASLQPSYPSTPPSRCPGSCATHFTPLRGFYLPLLHLKVVLLKTTNSCGLIFLVLQARFRPLAASPADPNLRPVKKAIIQPYNLYKDIKINQQYIPNI